MKKSELRKLISDYSLLKIKSKKHDVTDKLKQIEHRYFHETGRNIIDDMSQVKSPSLSFLRSKILKHSSSSSGR